MIALVLGGNYFCMVCPFTAAGRIVRKLSGDRVHLRWPKALRSKWLAVGLLAVFFWAYEAFALWDRPWASAWIAIAFFVGAGLSAAWFRDAPFCKYVCPIGQFNFVQSLFSPTEVASVSPQVCSDCRTKDCIAGNEHASGCGLGLYLPKKVGNMDCTFCFDCADACPHGNVALVSLGRGSDLTDTTNRSGVGRLNQRWDIAVLIALLFFAALVNAAWMTGPFLNWEDKTVDYFGVGRLPVVTLGMLLVLGVIPAGLLAATAMASARESVAGDLSPAKRINALAQCFARYAPALIPLGLGMWLAHYTFHLVTTWDAAGSAAHRAWCQLTHQAYEIAPVACACCRADGIAWLLPMEFCFLAGGLCASLAMLYRIGTSPSVATSAGMRAAIPWGILLVAYYGVCLWILLQPMQMRGAG